MHEIANDVAESATAVVSTLIGQAQHGLEALDRAHRQGPSRNWAAMAAVATLAVVLLVVARRRRRRSADEPVSADLAMA